MLQRHFRMRTRAARGALYDYIGRLNYWPATVETSFFLLFTDSRRDTRIEVKTNSRICQCNWKTETLQPLFPSANRLNSRATKCSAFSFLFSCLNLDHFLIPLRLPKPLTNVSDTTLGIATSNFFSMQRALSVHLPWFSKQKLYRHWLLDLEAVPRQMNNSSPRRQYVFPLSWGTPDSRLEGFFSESWWNAEPRVCFANPLILLAATYCISVQIV